MIELILVTAVFIISVGIAYVLKDYILISPQKFNEMKDKPSFQAFWKVLGANNDKNED